MTVLHITAQMFTYEKDPEDFYDFRDDDAEAVGKHKTEMRRRKVEAIKDPLKYGTPFTLNLTSPVTAAPCGRPLGPSLAKKRELCCELTTPLLTAYDEPHRKSQVWRARVVRSSAQRGSSHEVYTAKDPEDEGELVVKIMQQSLGPPYGSEDSAPMGWVAKIEGESYELAAQLQGTCIPYFFGVHEVRHVHIPPKAMSQQVMICVDGHSVG